MSTQAQRPNAAANRPGGLSADELRAEQAGDLPDREAMSILDVGGLNVGLPTPGDLDGALNTPDPLDNQPALGIVDNLDLDGGGQNPIDLGGQIPVDSLPVHTLPVDVGDPPTDGGGLIGIPELPDVPLDVETTA